MPKTKIQKLFFAVLTVFITVHLFVFYNVAIEMGGMYSLLIKDFSSFYDSPLLFLHNVI